MRTIDHGRGLPLALLLLVGCGSVCEIPWYVDGDGDGYGGRHDPVQACTAPEGYVDDARDCDDRDAGVYPGAPEACNGVDDDCDGTADPEAQTWVADLDGDGVGGRFTTVACAPPDGYVGTVGDCDDGNDTVFPGAPEACDGRDQDCDGEVDEGAPGDERWFPDDDRDGWGDVDGERWLCIGPAGWTQRAGDCNDAVPWISPDEPEVCDGVDNDCDGLVDAEDPSGLANAAFVYGDGDGDGVGSGVPELGCVALVGFSYHGDDCDDTDPEVRPGADEVCGGADEDCDGLVDDDDPSVDPATRLAGWADLDGDGLGDPDAPTFACAVGDGMAANDEDCDDGDLAVGGDDWLDDLDGDGAGAGTPGAGEDCAPPVVGMVNAAAPVDCDDTDPAVYTGAVDRCGDGVDADCTGIDPLCGVPLVGILSIEDLGRARAEGRSLLERLGPVGAGADFDGDGFVDLPVGLPDAGLVRVFRGPPPEGAPTWAGGTELVGVGSFGAALAAVADGTGDGLPDLLVGAPDDEGTGAARLFGAADWTTPAYTIRGLAGDEVGASVADGGVVDGAPVVWVGSPGRSEAGRVTVGTGEATWDTAAIRLVGAGRLGAAVVCCSTVSGVDDVVVAAPEDDTFEAEGGVVWLVEADLDPGMWAAAVVASAVMHGPHLGAAVATGGDVDGDGLRDVVASAPRDAGDAGRVFGITTPVDGAAAEVASWTLTGDFAGMAIGQSLALGDVDGDGIDDVAVGATDVALGGADGGAVYVFHGPVSGVDAASDADLVLFGPIGSRAGASIALGDYDPDPGVDLWIGLPGVSPGAAWLVPGP